MSKRDDDSQADLEVGMTTAERRRRRRRGGGLRVPSDNVPRRTNPPVVAPVPEDPSLAMSIAYSFSSDASEPIPLEMGESRGEPARYGEPPLVGMIPTVIDPVGPVEHQDFEMKTREMSAVDLEALGLTEPGVGPAGPTTQPMTRVADDAGTTDPALPGVEVRFSKPEPVAPADTSARSGSMTRELDGRGRAERADLEVDILDAGSTLDEPLAEDTARPVEARSPARHERLKTVALSEEDLEEVREAVRAASVPPTTPSPTAPPPVASTAPAVRPHTPTPPIVNRMPAPTPPPPIGGAAAPPPPPTPPARSSQSAASELWGDKPAKPAPPAPTPTPSKDASGSPPAPVAAAPTAPPAAAGSSSTQPLAALDVEVVRSDESPSMPEIDIQELAERAESSGEFEVDVEDADEVKSTTLRAAVGSPVQPPPAPAEHRRERPPSVPPPVAPSAATTHPGPPVAPVVAPPAKDHPHHPPPPPPPAAHKPPAPPPVKAKEPKAASGLAKADSSGKGPRGKPWFVDLFDEDYLRTLPFLTPQATQAEAEFVADAMGLGPGAQVLDVGCGYGRHAMELAARGFHVVGLDMSTPLLVRGGEEAQRRGLQINFVRGDMRELDFEGQFDGAYCLFSTFGYFDDETNKKTVANIARALKPGGRVLIEILNRDYVIADLPTRVWWEGDGCVVLEEVELNYFSSRIQVNRSVVFDDGRQLEQEISVRAYSLHEVGKLMHAAGFRVLEVSGGYQTRGRFFGNQSRHIIVLAERKEAAPT